MKKTILAVAMICALFMTSSFNVFAATVTQAGKTDGGQSGSIYTSATLTVNSNVALANTSAKETEGVTFATNVVYYYIGGNNQTFVSSNTGTTSASASCPNSSGQRATSQHYVSGVKWGTWSGSLSTSK